jgi:hypothetical protein
MVTICSKISFAPTEPLAFCFDASHRSAPLMIFSGGASTTTLSCAVGPLSAAWPKANADVAISGRSWRKSFQGEYTTQAVGSVL